jgi:cleavage stimulation factor subunit 3
MAADARALFERVIGTFSPERGRPLWERWARYEYQYGDLEAALKLEKRIAETYASGTSQVHLRMMNLGLLRSIS